MKINIFNLSSIKEAKNQLLNLQNRIKEQTELSVKQLTQFGYEYMMSIVKVDTGELSSSISWDFDTKENKGIIKVGAKHAIFVEFGTGIVGAASPHPDPKNWQYDVNSHGDAGWWYYDEKMGKLRWTKGQEASAFVYKTLEFMKKEAAGTLRVRLQIYNGMIEKWYRSATKFLMI